MQYVIVKAAEDSVTPLQSSYFETCDQRANQFPEPYCSKGSRGVLPVDIERPLLVKIVWSFKGEGEQVGERTHSGTVLAGSHLLSHRCLRRFDFELARTSLAFPRETSSF